MRQSEPGPAYYNLGFAAYVGGEHDQAAVLLSESHAVARLDNWFLEACVISTLGDLARLHSDYGSAARYYEEALDLARQHGSHSAKVVSIGPLNYVSLAQGDHQRVAVRFVEIASVGREFGDETTQGGP